LNDYGSRIFRVNVFGDLQAEFRFDLGELEARDGAHGVSDDLGAIAVVVTDWGPIPRLIGR
jgi:hypothetical protein